MKHVHILGLFIHCLWATSHGQHWLHSLCSMHKVLRMLQTWPVWFTGRLTATTLVEPRRGKFGDLSKVNSKFQDHNDNSDHLAIVITAPPSTSLYHHLFPDTFKPPEHLSGLSTWRVLPCRHHLILSLESSIQNPSWFAMTSFTNGLFLSDASVLIKNIISTSIISMSAFSVLFTVASLIPSTALDSQ